MLLINSILQIESTIKMNCGTRENTVESKFILYIMENVKKYKIFYRLKNTYEVLHDIHYSLGCQFK